MAAFLLNIPRGVTAYADHLMGDYAFKCVALHLELADIVVARATEQMDTPFRRHEFVWDFTPGSTTRDE